VADELQLPLKEILFSTLLHSRIGRRKKLPGVYVLAQLPEMSFLIKRFSIK
jgi:hypothetical protein